MNCFNIVQFPLRLIFQGRNSYPAGGTFELFFGYTEGISGNDMDINIRDLVDRPLSHVPKSGIGIVCIIFLEVLHCHTG